MSKLPQGGNHRTVSGDASEALFLYQALMRGWEVAKPFGHAHTYDFVCKFADKWETVQVKTGFHEPARGRSKEYVTAGVRRSLGRKYEAGQMDWLFVTHAPDFWLIPWSAISGFNSSICVSSPKWDQYKLPPLGAA